MDKVLALTWHLVDAGLHMTTPHKRVRMVWAGIGVGWSMFWLVRYFTTDSPKAKLIIIKEWDIRS